MAKQVVAITYLGSIVMALLAYQIRFAILLNATLVTAQAQVVTIAHLGYIAMARLA